MVDLGLHNLVLFSDHLIGDVQRTKLEGVYSMSKISSKGVAELLHEIRVQSGMSVSRLAMKSGLSESTIIRLETEGIHGFDILNKILEALDTDVRMYVVGKDKYD